MSISFSAHCKHVPCNTLTHHTNEYLLKIKRKGDAKFWTLSRTSDITETRNPYVIKIIYLACSTYIFCIIIFGHFLATKVVFFCTIRF